MEIVNTPSEMTPVQKRALAIFCESATILKDYKPDTFEQISKQLEKEDLKASSSSIQRWSKKYNFDEYLNFHIQSIMINDKENNNQQKAITVAVKKSIVDITRNNELTADCYELMELFAKQTADNFDNTGVIKRDDIKIIKDIATFTGGREDKLLDRIANAGADKITSAEMLEQHKTIEMDIEE
jgi:hypothetical protein